MVWQRLLALRAETVRCALEVVDQVRFAEVLIGFGLPVDEPWPVLAYEVLRRIVRREQPIEAFGLSARGEQVTALALLRQIDADIYQRALAHYEHSYRVSAQ